MGQEDPLKKGLATHSSILAWRIPWTEEPGRLQSMGLESAMTEARPKHKQNKPGKEKETEQRWREIDKKENKGEMVRGEGERKKWGKAEICMARSVCVCVLHCVRIFVRFLPLCHLGSPYGNKAVSNFLFPILIHLINKPNRQKAVFYVGFKY